MLKRSAKFANPLFSGSALTRLLIPLVIEQLLLITIGIADTIMVNSSGEAAVSGVSLVDGINMLIIQIFSALSTGGAVVVSQYLGHGDPENAKTASKQLIYTMVILSLLLTAIALISRQHLLRLFFGNVETAVMDNALVYFLLTASAYPFIAIYNAGAALFRANRISNVPMYCTLVINILNISVNALCIFGFKMGAAGAGVGTLVSRVVSAILIMLLLRYNKKVTRIDGIFKVKFRWNMIKRILFIGIPNGLENSMFHIGKLLVLNLITTFGTAAIAANAISNSVASIVNIPGMAVGLGMITVVGQCIGAGEKEQATFYSKRLLSVGYICMSILGLILFFTAAPLVKLFHLSPDAQVMATNVLRVCALGTAIIWPMAFTLPNALRAAGDGMFTMIVSLITMFACRVALSYVFACSWGLNLGLLGVWLAMIADWIIRAGFFIFRYCRGKWRNIKVI